MDLDSEAEQLGNQVQLFSRLTGIVKPDPTDRFFLVLGMTGSGKSTFISRCTGKSVDVGHGLHSCTDAIQLVEFESGGHRVYLLDTPGFNDTNRSDIDTLGILAAYLGSSYLNHVKIHGIIIMQPLDVNRMSGSAVRNINMMIAMCGFQKYHNVAIVTTMWPNSASPLERAAAESREEEIIKDDSFFGSLIKRGAIKFRYNQNGQRDVTNEKNSAQKVVTYLLDQADFHPPETLQLQREIVDEKKRLDETNAGIIVAQELHQVRKGYEVQVQDLKSQSQDQLRKKDIQYAAMIQELRLELQKKIEKLEEENEELRKEIEGLVLKEDRNWRKRIEEMNQQLRNNLIEKESELERLQKSSYIGDGRIKKAQQEASKARESYDKFAAKTDGIRSNVANGIASGLASGIISAVLAGSLFCTVM